MRLSLIKILTYLSLIMLSGCASVDSFISREQDLREAEVQKLYSLLESPTGNYEAIREIAFRNNPEVQLSINKIISYHSRLASFRKLLGISRFGGNPASSAGSVFDYACEVIKKAKLKDDPDFQALVIGFEKVKLTISQKLAEELYGLKRIKEEIRTLKIAIKEKEIEQKINLFFEEKGFSIAQQQDKDYEKNCQHLEKALKEKREKETKIFELCGLVRIAEIKK